MFEFFANVERENKEVLFMFDDFYLMVSLTFSQVLPPNR